MAPYPQACMLHGKAQAKFAHRARSGLATNRIENAEQSFNEAYVLEFATISRRNSSRMEYATSARITRLNFFHRRLRRWNGGVFSFGNHDAYMEVCSKVLSRS